MNEVVVYSAQGLRVTPDVKIINIVHVLTIARLLMFSTTKKTERKWARK